VTGSGAYPIQSAPAAPARTRSSILSYVTVSTCVWLMLWMSYNTGPSTLSRVPDDALGWAHYVRTLFPILILATPLLFVRIRRELPPLHGPLALWLVYGSVALVASAASPRPMEALYWAAAYLAVFAGLVVHLSHPRPLERARQLNRMSWGLTTLVLAFLLVVAREFLFQSDVSAYHVHGAADSVAGMPMTRSSGLGRFAAVPGVLAFSVMLAARRWRWRILAVPIFLFSAHLIYQLQSRGAIFGFVFALAFVMVFQGARSRLAGLLLCFALLAVHAGELAPAMTESIAEQVRRGQSDEQLRSMTGRTRAWQAAHEHAYASPLYGFGHMSDRFLIREHVHNTYLYVLLTGGTLGLVAFVTGLIWAWWAFGRALRTTRHLNRADHLTLVQAGGILAFFTIRSLPEVSGAHFSIDTLIMVPAIAYFSLAAREGRRLGTSSGGDG
jgi:O-antigen ligase